MKKLWTSGALLLLAAGCSPQGSNQMDMTNLAANGVDYRERVAEMPEGQRNSLFLRAIVGASLPCQAIESATPGTDSAGTPVWNVHCSGGHDRTVIIAPNGGARILDADPAGAQGTAGNQQ